MPVEFKHLWLCCHSSRHYFSEAAPLYDSSFWFFLGNCRPNIVHTENEAITGRSMQQICCTKVLLRKSTSYFIKHYITHYIKHLAEDG